MGPALGRFIALSLLIGALLWSQAERLGSNCSSALAAEIQWLDGTFEVQSLEVTREGGELVFRLAVGLARPVTVGGKTFNPDSRGQALSSTLVANAMLPAVLFLAALFARPRNHLFRLAVAVPGVVLIATVDVSLTLLANLWRIVYEAAGSMDYSPLVFWAEFVQDGGVSFLAIGSGALLAYLIETMSLIRARMSTWTRMSTRIVTGRLVVFRASRFSCSYPARRPRDPMCSIWAPTQIRSSHRPSPPSSVLA